MKGLAQHREAQSFTNDEFRKDPCRAQNCQPVLMALKPQEEIEAEVHQLDQLFRVESGSGEAVLDGARTPLRAGCALLVPAGARHHIINTGSEPLTLSTLYAPPNRRYGLVHDTRAGARADIEQSNGKIPE